MAMATIVYVSVPEGTAQQYDQVLGEVGVQKGSLPPGQLVRVASPAEGGWRVTAVWESQEAFDAFRGRLAAAFDKAGVRPSIDVAEVHDLAT
jgi:hypothetical protein